MHVAARPPAPDCRSMNPAPTPRGTRQTLPAQDTGMDNNDAQKKFLIGIAIKIVVVIGLGTAFAFWHLGQL